MVFRKRFLFYQGFHSSPEETFEFLYIFCLQIRLDIERFRSLLVVDTVPSIHLPSKHWQIELPAPILSYTIFFSLNVPSPYKVKTIVLLHIGGFCNACITKRCFCITQQMCHIMTLLRDCFVIKDFKKSNVFSHFFRIILGFLWMERL